MTVELGWLVCDRLQNHKMQWLRLKRPIYPSNIRESFYVMQAIIFFYPEHCHRKLSLCICVAHFFNLGSPIKVCISLFSYFGVSSHTGPAAKRKSGQCCITGDGSGLHPRAQISALVTFYLYNWWSQLSRIEINTPVFRSY